jgi:hypothetical protein
LDGGNEDDSIRTWDAETGTQIGSPVVGHSYHNPKCTCTHDPNGVFYQGNPTCTVIWHSCTVVVSVSAPTALSLSAGALASASNKTVRIWDASIGEHVGHSIDPLARLKSIRAGTRV